MAQEKARKKQQLFSFAEIALAVVAVLSLCFYLFRRWQARASKAES
jgi:hypothetical protein